jgi:hypothetical protein
MISRKPGWSPMQCLKGYLHASMEGKILHDFQADWMESDAVPQRDICTHVWKERYSSIMRLRSRNSLSTR